MVAPVATTAQIRSFISGLFNHTCDGESESIKEVQQGCTQLLKLVVSRSR